MVPILLAFLQGTLILIATFTFSWSLLCYIKICSDLHFSQNNLVYYFGSIISELLLQITNLVSLFAALALIENLLISGIVIR